MRALLALALFLAVPMTAAADCIPITLPSANDSERTAASLLCRYFRDHSGTKARVASDPTEGLALHVYVDDPAIITVFGKPEVAKKSVAGFIDTLPELWTREGRTMPWPVYFAVWSTDPTDIKPRVIWRRTKAGGELTMVKGDGLTLTR